MIKTTIISAALPALITAWIAVHPGLLFQHGADMADDIDTTNGLAEAMFGAGCFWGVQAEFDKTPGVRSTRVGYSGGLWDNPTYKDVCSDMTGHAEVVHVYFDPVEIAYDSLLTLFFQLHDPTQLNRQGPDVGTQYRSVIFYYNEEQKRAAEEMLRQLDMSGRYSRPVVTQIKPAEVFWDGEEYHQKYLEKRGLTSCHTQ